ncbi:lens epithelium-derived growth factor-like [Ptychodera flava]|uniref:lens epithelium-derived growth factor-like n=1 Tax=Ptychodera flava TaxID=63121 RepID=UPI003969CDB0
MTELVEKQKKQTEEKKKEKPEKKKFDKLDEKELKKLEKKKLNQLEQILEEFHIDIKQSLALENPDNERCIRALVDIENLDLSGSVLRKNTEFLQTLKKIRKYKGNKKVREKAEYLYHRFKLMFLKEGEANDSATSRVVFERLQSKQKNKQSKHTGDTQTQESTENGDKAGDETNNKQETNNKKEAVEVNSAGDASVTEQPETTTGKHAADNQSQEGTESTHGEQAVSEAMEETVTKDSTNGKQEEAEIGEQETPQTTTEYDGSEVPGRVVSEEGKGDEEERGSGDHGMEQGGIAGGELPMEISQDDDNNEVHQQVSAGFQMAPPMNPPPMPMPMSLPPPPMPPPNIQRLMPPPPVYPFSVDRSFSNDDMDLDSGDEESGAIHMA